MYSVAATGMTPMLAADLKNFNDPCRHKAPGSSRPVEIASFTRYRGLGSDSSFARRELVIRLLGGFQPPCMSCAYTRAPRRSRAAWQASDGFCQVWPQAIPEGREALLGSGRHPTLTGG